ncbi:helix-turn-helix domain-containing protein [Promicromonospora kroppenstedtii]|uniref:Helix-turn-helix domain-containing protein n=1 Tax=Promicromonospora kroppenstedtii TaxID=440482 RepID=A0ABW7XPE7_9MICO
MALDGSRLDAARLDAARLVKRARHSARQTQASLAGRAGVARGTVAAIETGARSPSWDMLTALLAAAGMQMRIELEPLDADVRQQIVEHRHDPDLPARVWFAVEGIEDLADLDLRVEGLAAAALLGAPVTAGDPQIAVARTERSMEWLADKLGRDRIRLRPPSWLGHAWPRTPQEAFDLIETECPDGWIMVRGYFGETPVRFAPAEDVARHVLVANGERPIPVQPLHEIETTDRNAARVLRLLREQAQDARD